MKVVVDKHNKLKEVENKLQNEIQDLQEKNFTAKRSHDDNLRDLETSAREDEYSKYHALLQDLEGKVRQMEEQRELARRNYYDTVDNKQTEMKREMEDFVKV